MSLLFFFPLLDDIDGGEPRHGYFQPSLEEPRRIKKKREYTITKSGRLVVAQEITNLPGSLPSRKLASGNVYQQGESMMILHLLMEGEL